jgi:putative spermidine/putrescine transport system permease protein
MAPSRPQTTRGNPYRARRTRLLVALLAPAMVIGMTVASTFMLMAYVSVQTKFPGVPSFTLQHYVEFFQDSYLLETAVRTITLGAVTTLLCAVMGYPVAWFLVMSSSRHAYIVFTVILAPLLVSIVVRTIGWTVILGNEGLINAILLKVGLISAPLPLMQSFWSVVVGMVHVLLPFMVLSICSVLGKIDRSALEAAMTLGATRPVVFRLITFPLSIEGVMTGAVIVFCLTVGSYLTPLWLGRGSVQVMALTIRQQVMDFGDWPGGAAQAVLLATGAMAIIISSSIATQRLGRR